ncbi:MAG: hypothetical protein ACRD8Z_28640, partial [Nitrososphaeraceae archaeon]
LWFQYAEQIRTTLKESYGPQLRDVDERLSVIKEEIRQVDEKLKSVDDEALNLKHCIPLDITIVGTTGYGPAGRC